MPLGEYAQSICRAPTQQRILLPDLKYIHNFLKLLLGFQRHF